MNFIKLHLAGHLGKDPEIKYTPSGKAVSNFSVAFNPGKKEDSKPPVWFNCKAWGEKLAEKLKGMKKGEGIRIANAFLDVETWKDSEGNEKSKQVWIVMEIEVANTKPDSDASLFSVKEEKQQADAQDIPENEIPF